MPCNFPCRRFKGFRDIHGLNFHITNQFTYLEEYRGKVLEKIDKFANVEPTMQQVLNSSNCKKCRDYFGKTGEDSFFIDIV